MRRKRFLSVSLLCATLVIPARSSAQFERPVRSRRAWLVVSDGVGPNGGGLQGTTGLVQLFRASGIVAVTPTLGVEVTGLRIQELFPGLKVLNDPALNSPRADGVFAALAQFNRDGPGRGFPALASLGGGVVRRPTNDSTKKRLTGAIQVGIESSLWRPSVDWVDATGGLRLILMPAGNRHQIYILALTLGLRVG